MTKEKLTKGKIESSEENVNLSSNTKADYKGDNKLSTFSIFEKCIKRAENLIDIHSKTEKNNDISKEYYDDCYRAVIVLIISAFDGYIRSTIIDLTRDILSNDNVPLSRHLKEYLEKKLNHKTLIKIARNGNLMDVVGKFMINDFDNKSFQGEFKIDNHFKMVGIDNIFEKISVMTNVNESNLRKDISKFTQRRHYIAHTGDYNITETLQEEFEINKEFAESCLKTITNLAKNINIIIKQQKGTRI